MATDGLDQLYTTQFTTMLNLKLQQQSSKLRGKTQEGFHVGKMASPVNQIGAVQLRAPAGRFAPLNRTDNNYTRRWVFPQDGEIVQMVDSFDELKTIVSPNSQLVASAAAAVGRGWDDVIIAQALGTAQTGNDAASLTAEAWTSNFTNYLVANTFDAGATSVGLTVNKLIEAKRIFRHNHVDLESDELTIIIGSTQEADLLRQTEVVSREYNDRPVLVDGTLARFLGFNIIVSERLVTNGGGNPIANVRSCIAFVKSGLYLGIWKDMTTIASQRNDLSGHPSQFYTQVSYGATRLELGRLVEVQCADTVGADITP
jgi:hypothetical protein